MLYKKGPKNFIIRPRVQKLFEIQVQVFKNLNEFHKLHRNCRFQHQNKD